VAPEYRIEVFPIENTWFLDWYFGLDRLFSEGARPAIIALCLTRQLIGYATDGEYFARYVRVYTRNQERVPN
jgi:hypothetical protein